MKQILRKPVITEKSIRHTAESVFTFLVDVKSTKHQIAREVERAFAVHVLDVTTSIVKGGGMRRGRRRMLVQDPARKIARVHLKSGEKIALFNAKKE